MNNHIPPIVDFDSSHHIAETGELVIALHCSGGNARQWRGLAEELGTKVELQTPEHYGTSPNKNWPTDKMLTLADEAVHSLQLIDNTDKNVHLVGHSYGGALALHIAMARPDRISSISLYEPCAFHLLRSLGVMAATALSEINRFAAKIYQRVGEGDNAGAMQGFVDYWNGEGAFWAMKPAHRDHLLPWAPNAVNAFDALFAENTPQSEYQNLNVPVQLVVGGSSPDPVRVVSSALARLLPDCRINELPGVGHMGPLTHAGAVNRIIKTHIESNSSHANSHVKRVGVSVDTVAVAA